MGFYEIKLLFVGAGLALIGAGVFKEHYQTMGAGWALAIIALLLPS